MIFFVLSENKLTIHATENKQELVFPGEIVRYQEIIDKQAFEKLLRSFFTKSQKKYRLGIFLDHNLIYHKAITIKTKTPDIIKIEEEKFFSLIPIAQNASARLSIFKEQELFLLSTYKHIFITIKDVLKSIGWEVEFVVPLSVFSENTRGTLTYKELNKFQKQKKLIKLFNFLTAIDTTESTKKKAINKRLLLFAAITFIPFITLIAIIFFIFNSSQNTSRITPTPTLTTTPPASPTLTPITTTSAIPTRQQLRIQIFNGSGTPGEAGRIRDRLASLGFNTIEIGDSDGVTSNATIAIFSERTPPTYQDEILRELEALFDVIETQRITTSDLYDVFITTGTSQ